MDELLCPTPEALSEVASRALDRARSRRAELVALPAEASYGEVLAAFDRIGEPLNGVAGATHLMFQVHPELAVRGWAAEVEQEFSRFGTELSLDREVYERLAGLPEDQAPDATSRRVVEHALRDFRRAGVDRDEATRERVAALRAELVELGQAFARAIAEDVRQIVIEDPEATLVGMPEDWVAAHPPGADGRVVVTTNPPDLVPFMKFCTSREHRRALHRKATSRGSPGNLAVLDRIIARRHELAGLLGYPSWAAYVTEDKMIRSPENAAAFIERVGGLTEERIGPELAELGEVAAELGQDPADLRDFDRTFLTERLRRTRYDFDVRAVREYLPYAAVQQGVLDTLSRLYGLEVRPCPERRVWHADVQAFELVEDGRPLARFLLDMHPREGKFKHAAMFDLASGLEDEVLPEACLVCNLPRPTDDDPALLDPNDVQTLFHEFGHLLHHLLAGRHRYLATSGIATEWDFVEVPSQLFEEWARDPGVLATFAHHHETGEPVPAELVQRMNRAEEVGKALQTRVQMFYASLSLEYFRADPTDLDTTAVMRGLKGRWVPFPHEEGTAFQASFGHLDGYSALYYTYMWSLVLAKDVLSAFGGDLMDRAVADRYRHTVLAPGGSRDAADLVAEFLGRPFRFDAFEAWLAA